MLKLKNISKSYKTGDFTQHALNNVDLEFRKNEFVAILGPSGSGKTTLLNIIGGLDRYDKGDLIINGKSTKKFKDKDWDAYRNNCIGFIFQSYNLIPHISVLENVEMALTLSGIRKKTRKKKAIKALEKVGLKDHIHKKPNQLSGGQMQRVAIARSLVNDPEIILADEPTGALDTKTSKQIMDLIKEIAKDKLVIMVTHNPELANIYSTRIVEFLDGNLTNDTNPILDIEENDNDVKIKKTSMKFLTALNLSFNNIKTKKGRTSITAFASSIGIIGIALILSLSNGFDIQINKFEKETLSQSPIIVSEQAMTMDEDTMKELNNESLEKYPKEKKVYSQKDIESTLVHTNNITEEYVDYIKNIDSKYTAGIIYQRATNFIVINKNNNNEYKLITPISEIMSWSQLPVKENNNVSEVVSNNFDVIAGAINNNEPGLVLQLDNKNQLYESTLKQLGIEDKEISFDEIMNKEIKIVLNDDYYEEQNGYFIPSTDLEKLYNNKNNITVKVQAIIRGKEGKEMLTQGKGITYTEGLSKLIIEKNKNSKIVKAQKEKDYNILTNIPFDEKNTKKSMLAYLGEDTTPIAISIFPSDFDSKDNILNYLDKYNEDKEEKDTIQYTDMAAMISSLTGNIMDAITIVLIAFSAISLIVSSIMIGIITYISVLERTKEIGILRALGARKKDISRVFNAEVFIIGLTSGILGIVITCMLLIPANIILKNLTDLENVARLNPIHALILIIISLILTLIGGFIPAKMASKKDPVIALRTE